MFTCCLSPGSGAKLSCSPGWFESPHWLHYRSRHFDEWGTVLCRWVATLTESWQWVDLPGVSALSTEWGSLLHHWNVWRERAEAVCVQHRYRQLPRGGHHSKLWLGWRGKVWRSSGTSTPWISLMLPVEFWYDNVLHAVNHNVPFSTPPKDQL